MNKRKVAFTATLVVAFIYGFATAGESDDPSTHQESTVAAEASDDPENPISGADTGTEEPVTEWTSLALIVDSKVAACLEAGGGFEWEHDSAVANEIELSMASEMSSPALFILAVNVSEEITDTEVRDRAGIPDNITRDLKVVRVSKIATTDGDRCEPKVDSTPRIELALGILSWGEEGDPSLNTNRGVFAYSKTGFHQTGQ